MQRFILRENIARFEKLLAEATDESLSRTVQAMLASARRELAIREAELVGARRSLPAFGYRISRDLEDGSRFQQEFKNSPHPYLLLDPGPGLRIVDVNEAYTRATMTSRETLVGAALFDIFPDNPEDASADGVNNLFASLRIVVETGQSHAMRDQRYDVRDQSGQFVERHWRPVNSPVFNEAEHLIYLLHHVDDVTDEVLSVLRQPPGANPDVHPG